MCLDPSLAVIIQHIRYIMYEKRLLFGNGPIVSLVRHACPVIRTPGKVPGSNLVGDTMQKIVRFFLLIEKTLGNVSPCLELALSQSFNGTWE